MGGQSQSQIQRPLLHMVESFKSPRLLTRVRNTFPHLFSRDRGVLPGCCKVALKGSSTESQMIFLRPNRRPEPQTQQSTNGVPAMARLGLCFSRLGCLGSETFGACLGLRAGALRGGRLWLKRCCRRRECRAGCLGLETFGSCLGLRAGNLGGAV